MKHEIIMKSGGKPLIAEKIECILCGCQFKCQIGDLYDSSYTEKGKVANVRCLECNAPLHVREDHIINQTFKEYFTLDKLPAKHLF